MNMKWFWDPCRRCRSSISLLASGAPSDPEMDRLIGHLANCADCRKYHDEMVSLARPLADWETNFAYVEPTPETQSRWVKAIQGAVDVNRRKEPVREFTFAVTLGNAVRLSFLELVWTSRRIWTGLASVWILILAANFSMQDRSQTTMAKTAPSAEMIMTWRQQERLLAELIGPNEPRVAVPPKPFSPRPSSERRFETLKT
jgi:predicted anti-sigma-YlaC factor YlaD